MRFFFLLIIFLSYNTPSYAYLDPGTGAIIIQAIIGAFAAIVVYWNKFKIYIKTFFFTKKKNTDEREKK